jgi:hypothetical protein
MESIVRQIILLQEEAGFSLYEYKNCRFTVSEKSPIHMCIVAFDEGKRRLPETTETDFIINTFFRNKKRVILLRKLMFSEEAIHIWEATNFSRKILESY